MGVWNPLFLLIMMLLLTANSNITFKNIYFKKYYLTILKKKDMSVNKKY